MNKLPMKRYFRPDEAARVYDVSRRTIYRWADEGKIEAVKMPGGGIRIPREEIEKDIEKV